MSMHNRFSQTPTRAGARSTVLVLLIALLGTAVAGCVQVSDRDLRPVELERLSRWIQEDVDTVIVDVRTAEAYQQQHIFRAVHIPLDRLHGEHPELTAAERIVVYGNDMFDNRAPAAAKKLMRDRVDDVYLFRGGFEQWQSSDAASGS